MALALGVSVANATSTCGSGVPSICLGSETADSSSITGNKNFNITWSDIGNNIYEMTTSQSGITANGNFAFYLEGSSQNNGGVAISDDDGYKAQIDSSFNSLTIKGNGNTIKMGSNGWGKLSLGGGAGKTLTLDLSGIALTNYALDGSLFIGSWDSGKVDATFGGKGLSGMVRVGGGTNNTITFTENAEVGKFWFHKGTTTITFEKNATIRAGDSGSGIIYTGNSYTTIGNGTGGQTFVFNGTNNIIENTSGGPVIDITANADASNLNNTYNRLIFKKGVNTITGKIQSQINSNTKTDNSGKNFIVFESTTTNNTITGDIYSAFGYNTIVFAGASNSNSTLDNLVTTAGNRLIGSVSSKGLNSNFNGRLVNSLIYFKENGYLQGNISADSNPTGGINYARNIIVFEKKGYIRGDITGSGVNEWINRNYLVFGGEAKIEGTINKANNNILLSSTNSNLTITELVYGNTTIWSSSQDMSVSGTLDYNSDTAYKTAVTNFFGDDPENRTNPNNNDLVGTLNLKKGITDEGVYGVDIRVDILNIDTNTDDPNSMFSIKSSNTWGSTFVIKTSGLIKGNIITEKVNTNISLVGDDTTLTLQGQSNQISTLTAKSGATTGDTLIIDSTNNANATTINSIVNGDSLIVNFKGQGENKEATLNLKSTPTLKQVIVDNNSTNNTLDLTQTSKTTINTKISIADNQQLAINLDNTELALANGAVLETTGGNSTINVSNTGTLSGGNIMATTLNLNGTANAILKSANTTFANLVAESGTLTLGEGSANATINSTNSTFNATFSGNSAQTLAINGGKNTITTLTLNAQTNTLSIGEGNTTITNAITSDTGNSLTLQIGNSSKSASLTLLDTIKTENTGIVNVVFAGTSTPSTLTLNGDNNILTSVNATNSGTLIANNTSATITALTGDKLTAGFSGNSASSIAINGANSGGKTITLADVVLNNNAKGTLDLSSLENTTITNNVSVGENQSLAINLGGTDATLTFTGGLSGNATINAGATTSNTIAGNSIALSNLNLSGTDNTTTLTTNSATINTLNANATTSNKLVLDATNNTSGVSASINSIGSTTRSAGSLNVTLNGSAHTTTLLLNGNTINSLDIQGDNNNLVGNAKITSLASVNGGSLNINGGNVEVATTIIPTSSHNMSLALNSGAELTAKQGLDSSNANINLTLNNSTLSLGATSTITSLSGNSGVIDFVSSGKDTSKSLTISDNCNANANVITYVDTSKSEKANLVTVSGTNSTGVLTISAVGNADEIFSITYDASGSNNVKVAQIGNSGTDKAVGGTSDIEGEIIQISLSTDGSGGYYIGSAISKGVDTSVQEVVTSALAVNYDLYLANFNSLNKRMGELRNIQESNGVWARVFGGAMSNDFGVGSKTDYITTQAGYDYSLSVGDNARNFIGVAIAYGASSTKSNPSSNPNTGVLDNISSSMVEVGLYNSYVADSGWYNDTIFKFDYIMSDFTLKTGSNSQQNSTSNFAMILSDEFGYRYSFGENEKGSWYIDPQAEFAFGYFNQSDFNQALNESATRTIKATQDSILTLRSRVGASLGKKFNTDKGFASLYVGAFYEYDYIEGGKSDYALISSQGEVSNPLQSLESNGRAILNVGSNIELTKGARLYIDVEKSFGDKQRTFMQFNLGARYSF